MKSIGWLVCFLIAFAGLSEGKDTAKHDADLSALLEKLSANTAMESQFNESRHRGFRRVPADFIGTMRWDAKLGLSLSYSEPHSQVLLIRQDAVFQSRRGSPPRRMPASAEADFLRSIMLDVFHFDAEVWAENFSIEDNFDDNGQWVLELSPLEGSEVRELVHRIQVSGNADKVRRIEIWRDERSRLEIEITSASPVEEWDEPVLREAFFVQNEPGGEP